MTKPRRTACFVPTTQIPAIWTDEPHLHDPSLRDGAIPHDDDHLPDIHAAGLTMPNEGETALILPVADSYGAVGIIKLHSPSISKNLGDMGYWVEPKRRGQLWGRHLLMTGIGLISKHRRQHSIRIVCHVSNKASAAVAIACVGQERTNGSSSMREFFWLNSR